LEHYTPKTFCYWRIDGTNIDWEGEVVSSRAFLGEAILSNSSSFSFTDLTPCRVSQCNMATLWSQSCVKRIILGGKEAFRHSSKFGGLLKKTPLRLKGKERRNALEENEP